MPEKLRQKTANLRRVPLNLRRKTVNLRRIFQEKKKLDTYYYYIYRKRDK